MRVALPLLRDAQQGLRVRRLHEMDRTARLPGAERERPPRHVEQGEHADGAAVAFDAEARKAPQAVDPVGEHHSLGRAGTPAGEEDDVRVALVELRFVDVRFLAVVADQVAGDGDVEVGACELLGPLAVGHHERGPR